jgi:hypothetical protein
VKLKRRRSDRITPQSRQPVEHRLGVGHAARDADEPTDERDRNPFSEQQPSHPSGREPEREKRTDLREPLLDAELKHQRHEDQCGENQEEAEANEQPSEILRLAGSGEGLSANGPEL